MWRFLYLYKHAVPTGLKPLRVWHVRMLKSVYQKPSITAEPFNSPEKPLDLKPVSGNEHLKIRVIRVIRDSDSSTIERL